MPTITGVSPQAFGDGRQVTVTGSGFGTSGTVTIGGLAQTVTSWTDTAVVFTAVRGTQSMGPAVLNVVSGIGTAPFFTDGFESGNLAYTQNGASWLVGTNTSVQSGRGNPGYALQFTFAGTADATDPQNSIAEQRFDLGTGYNELTLTFDLYIPDGTESWGGAAYTHRDAVSGGNNNKFLRLFETNTDTNSELVGFSLYPGDDNGSKIRAEWNAPSGGGMTEHGAARTPFIIDADRGTWVAVKIYFKFATATANGTLNVWKNGTLILDNSNLVQNYWAGSPHSWRYGYLLGAANTGFLATTYLQVDNVRWYAGAI